MTFLESIIAMMLVVFGLIITWQDGNVGEGQNFILAGAASTYIYTKWKKD